MYSIISFGIFALMLIQIRADDSMDEILLIKSKVAATNYELNENKTNLRSTLNFKLDDLKFKQLANADQLANDALANRRIMFNNLNEKGINLNHCYNESKKRLRDMIQNVYSESAGYALDEIKNFKVDEQHIKPVFVNGEALLKYIEGSIKACENDDPKESQRCIGRKLPNVKAAVEGFENSVLELKKFVMSSFDLAENHVRQCFQQELIKLSTDIESDEINVQKCIKGGQ